MELTKPCNPLDLAYCTIQQEKNIMKKGIGILLSLMMLASSYAQASIIVTADGDDSVLLAILGFDAGSLGIVDIDFGGSSFDSAFGTEASPSGYLFTNSGIEARAILDSMSSLLNSYNSSASTPITQILDSVFGTTAPLTLRSRFNVAYGVNAFAIGHQRSSFNGSSWNWNASTSSLARFVGEPSFARMTAATTVPAPATLALLIFGLALAGWHRSKLQKCQYV